MGNHARRAGGQEVVVAGYIALATRPDSSPMFPIFIKSHCSHITRSPRQASFLSGGCYPPCSASAYTVFAEPHPPNFHFFQAHLDPVAPSHLPTDIPLPRKPLDLSLVLSPFSCLHRGTVFASPSPCMRARFQLAVATRPCLQTTGHWRRRMPQRPPSRLQGAADDVLCWVHDAEKPLDTCRGAACSATGDMLSPSKSMVI